MADPIEPPECLWQLPDPLGPRLSGDLVAVGADLEPGTLLAAYRTGLFPMHVETDEGRKVGWWSPMDRAVIELDALAMSRSLRRSLRRFTWTIDEAFDSVVAQCARTHEDPQWIDDDIKQAYHRLHQLGWAHSIEVWQGGQLVGGLYGVSIGAMFNGESMFHLVPDASKVALVRLIEIMNRQRHPDALLDVQWRTEHLGRMGATEISCQDYVGRVRRAIAAPSIRWDREVAT